MSKASVFSGRFTGVSWRSPAGLAGVAILRVARTDGVAYVDALLARDQLQRNQVEVEELLYHDGMMRFSRRQCWLARWVFVRRP